MRAPFKHFLPRCMPSLFCSESENISYSSNYHLWRTCFSMRFQVFGTCESTQLSLQAYRVGALRWNPGCRNLQRLVQGPTGSSRTETSDRVGWLPDSALLTTVLHSYGKVEKRPRWCSWTGKCLPAEAGLPESRECWANHLVLLLCLLSWVKQDGPK